MTPAELVGPRARAPNLGCVSRVLGPDGGDFETEVGMHESLLWLVFTDYRVG
jgi:hypothetical protein